MPSAFESSGEIEVVLHKPSSRGYAVGDRVQLVFAPIGAANPPYRLKILSPSGASILETILRDLPTGEAQSADAVSFLPFSGGVYQIDIQEMRGRASGKAKLTIA